MKKSVEQTLLERRSIRRYEYDPIPEGDMDFIYAAIRNTPTSYNGQQFSVIDICDQDIKQKLYEITNQKQIKTCSHFLVFVADYHKMETAWKVKGVEPSVFPATADGYTVGVIDASLALMSALVAAESRGIAGDIIRYDREIQKYNATRAGGSSDNDWVAHITDYYREGERYNSLAAARAQGFLTEEK